MTRSLKAGREPEPEREWESDSLLSICPPAPHRPHHLPCRLLILLFAFLFSSDPVFPLEATTIGMSVQVARTAVRSEPSVAGSILGYLAYGIRVSVVETTSGWSRILVADVGSGFGWVRASALVQRKLPVIPTGGSPSEPAMGLPKRGVSESEIVLAGRGFSGAIEEFYGSSSMLDYSWVDTMEGYGMDEASVLEFLAGIE